MAKAYIVWNSDRTEGVIFVDDGKPPIDYAQTAEQDAMQAMTGKKYNMAWSSLAEQFNDMYDEGDNELVVVEASVIQGLGD